MDFTTLDGAQSAPLPTAEVPVSVTPEVSLQATSVEDGAINVPEANLQAPLTVEGTGASIPSTEQAPNNAVLLGQPAGQNVGVPTPPSMGAVDGVLPPTTSRPELQSGGVGSEKVFTTETAPAAPSEPLPLSSPPVITPPQPAPIMAVAPVPPIAQMQPQPTPPRRLAPDTLIRDILSPRPKEQLDDLLFRLELAVMSQSEQV
ncbi:MAG TPA: hypothetical protein VGE59_04790 [Patescibacteria group bacterium]